MHQIDANELKGDLSPRASQWEPDGRNRSGGHDACPAPPGFPALGDTNAADVARLLHRRAGRLGEPPLRPGSAAILASPTFWRASVAALGPLSGLGARRHALQGRWWADVGLGRLRHALTRGRVAALLSRCTAEAEPSEHARAKARIVARLEQEIPPRSREGSGSSERPRYPSDIARAEAWDTLYEQSADPWDYETSAYERIKYEETLELLPPGRPAQALELACAEGVFTRMLAGRVERLIATDISAVALSRAAARCRDMANVSFQRLNFASDPLPPGCDLIVCSEALYFAGSRQKLRGVTRKIAASLVPGGVVLSAHAKQTADEPEGSGFDWAEDFGSKTICESFAASGLVLQREIETPLYRVSAFRKPREGEAPERPQRERRPLRAPLEPRVAASVVWDGGYSRAKAARQELTMRVPVLHFENLGARQQAGEDGISPETFEAHIRRLRRLGYRSLALPDLLAARAANTPLRGRPLILTFGGDPARFEELAWPVLSRHGFGAVFFAPCETPLSGGQASLDPDWARLRRLAASGLEIGATTAHHQPLATQTTPSIYETALRARRRLEVELGPVPATFRLRPPDGCEAHRSILADCGYELAFTATTGRSHLNEDPFGLSCLSPRAEEDAHGLEARLLGKAS
jgi:hypothetical protein